MDANRQLVMNVFDAVKILLSRCAPYIKQNFTQYSKTLEEYGTLVLETFQNKVFQIYFFKEIKNLFTNEKTTKIYCQMENKEEECDEDFDENLAEYDYMLKEYAGDVIPSLALCLPESYFYAYFEKAIVFLIRILNKSESSSAEKSFAIGVVGETLCNLENIDPFKAQKLFTGILLITLSL